uniref:Uncharacterized protein n=2 Tax=viral metagenome TaxID=1070528 RepID=A0A6H1ZUZ8_9ZZZZ
MKTRITSDDHGRVRLQYEDCLGQDHDKTFSCPHDGGYVIELLDNGGTTQPCDGLSHTGNTLIAKNRETLIDLIRREYRQMRRIEAREMSL